MTDMSIRERVARLLMSDLPLDDMALDALLGIPDRFEETEQASLECKRVFNRGERALYQGTTYDVLRTFLRTTMPGKDDVVYDLGAGYGRLLFFGGLVSHARYKGVEIVKERVKVVNDITARLGLENVSCVAENVRDCWYGDGNIFFLFNPFNRPTLEAVGDKLRRIAKDHPITVGSVGFCSIYFNEQPWLERTIDDGDWFLQVYKSK